MDIPPSTGLKGNKNLMRHQTTLALGDKSTNVQVQKIKQVTSTNLRKKFEKAYKANIARQKNDLAL